MIKAGTFMMGSPETEPDRDSDEPQSRVTISKDFFLGKHEVTVGQFRKFCASTGYKTEHEREGDEYNWDKPLSGMHQTDDHPVQAVSWEDATAYCEWLSKTTGERYRLPLETEWEYACRAGTTTAFSTGDTLSKTDANYDNTSEAYPYLTNKVTNPNWGTTRVGSFKPNSFGLYDMHGNAFEWCADVYRNEELTETLSGQYHTIRGGAWSMSTTDYCRSAHREGMEGGNGMTGFRVAKDFDKR